MTNHLRILHSQVLIFSRADPQSFLQWRRPRKYPRREVLRGRSEAKDLETVLQQEVQGALEGRRVVPGDVMRYFEIVFYAIISVSLVLT